MNEPSKTNTHGGLKGQILDPTVGKRLLLLLFMSVFMLLIGISLWAACAFYRWLSAYVVASSVWALVVLGSILVFNYAYLLALLILRLIVPPPREGYFPTGPGGRPPPEAILFMMNVLLSLLRYGPPWARLFSGMLVGLPPLNPLYRRFFGPHTRSLTMGDTTEILDPYLFYAGNNVQLGIGLVVACHAYDNRGLVIKRVVVEDNAVVGAHAGLMVGSYVGHHAIVTAGSQVMPFTRIGPWELWGGTPAVKIRDLPRDDGFTGAAASKPAVAKAAKSEPGTG